MSRAWAFYVNSVASSPLVTRGTRARIYRACGFDFETEFIFPRCYFHTTDIALGPGAILNHGVHIENVARVTVGARTGLGLFTVVLTSNHEVGPHETRLGDWLRLPVTIGDGCWIGARCLILPGVTIGDGCIVAAGSVVREDCEADGVYAGVPARRVKDLDP
jgi:maltose O-acetyltransferase